MTSKQWRDFFIITLILIIGNKILTTSKLAYRQKGNNIKCTWNFNIIRVCNL